MVRLVRLLRFEGTGPVNEFPSKRLQQRQGIQYKLDQCRLITSVCHVDAYTASKVRTSPRVEGMLPVRLLSCKSLHKSNVYDVYRIVNLLKKHIKLTRNIVFF